jgi:Mn-dependent DtxR family transcriptional regulator
MVTNAQLTAAQQDCLEAAYLVAGAEGRARITDIAAELGTRLPTVVRNVARLKQLKLVRQSEREPVELTSRGEQLATQLAHRHRDLAQFLTAVLGVDAEVADGEACMIEHGVSAATAMRLHRFLEKWERIEPALRRRLKVDKPRPGKSLFRLIRPVRGTGRHR